MHEDAASDLIKWLCGGKGLKCFQENFKIALSFNQSIFSLRD